LYVYTKAAAALKKENDAALKEETAEGTRMGLATRKEQFESLQLELTVKVGCTS
jgi:hypothetical protein